MHPTVDLSALDPPELGRGEALTKARVTLASPLTDRVDVPEGSTLAVLDSIERARAQLLADVERCRYVVLPGHQCATRDGAPLNEGQVCWYEAAAQLREDDRQPREQAVPCRGCSASTWNRSACCDECRRGGEAS